MIIAAMLYSYPPDRLAGADIMSQRLLEALAAHGHKVTVYTMQEVEERDQNGVHVMYRPRSLPLSKANCDLLYTHPDLASQPYSLARSTQIPIVGVVHNTTAQMHSVLGSRRGALLVWNSESTRTALAGVGGIVCHPPFKVIDHAPHMRPIAFGGSPMNADTVTLVNLNQEKGARIFWDLAAARPDLQFLGVVGAYGWQLVQHPTKGALPNVDVIGPVHPSRMVDQVWDRTRVLLAPSEHESWGMTAVEAMCNGIPIVASPTPGLRESVGELGRWVERSKPTQVWSDAIDDAWNVDPLPFIERARDLEMQIALEVGNFVHHIEELAPK